MKSGRIRPRRASVLPERSRDDPRVARPATGPIAMIAPVGRITLTSAPMAAADPARSLRPAEVRSGRREDLPLRTARTSRASPTRGVARSRPVVGIRRTIGLDGVPMGRAVAVRHGAMIGPAGAIGRSGTRAPTVRDTIMRLIARRARGIPLTARGVRTAARRIATATIVRIGSAPTETGKVDESAGMAIGPTGKQVRTAAIGPIAIVRAPRVRTVIVQLVTGTSSAARAARVRTGVGRVRIGIVLRVRIGVGRVRIGIVRAVRVRTVVVPTPIGAVRLVRAARDQIGAGPTPIGTVRVAMTPVPTTVAPRMGVAAAAVSTETARAEKARTAIVPRMTEGIVTSETARRPGSLIAIGNDLICPTVTVRIAIPPTGSARAAEVPIAIGRRRPAVEPIPTAAITRIAIARRANGPTGRAGHGRPASERRAAAVIGRIRDHGALHDRSARHARIGMIARGTRMRREPTNAVTRRQGAPVVRIRTARMPIAHGTLPTIAARRVPTAVPTTIVPRARRAIGHAATRVPGAATIVPGATTATRAGLIVMDSTGRQARGRTPASAVTSAPVSAKPRLHRRTNHGRNADGMPRTAGRTPIATAVRASRPGRAPQSDVHPMGEASMHPTARHAGRNAARGVVRKTSARAGRSCRNGRLRTNSTPTCCATSAA